MAFFPASKGKFDLPALAVDFVKLAAGLLGFWDVCDHEVPVAAGEPRSAGCFASFAVAGAHFSAVAVAFFSGAFFGDDAGGVACIFT